jgi:hypothetical protein
MKAFGGIEKKGYCVQGKCEDEGGKEDASRWEKNSNNGAFSVIASLGDLS